MNLEILKSKTVYALISLLAILSCSKDDDMPIFSGDSSNSGEPIFVEAQSDLKGYKIAFGNELDIYMMNPDGSNIEQLTTGGNISGYVSWGPEAKYVYFASIRGDNIDSEAWEAYRVNVTTKELTKISNFDLDVRSLGVSPDNQTLAISVMTGNSSIGNNNDNLTQFSTNLYMVSMATVEAKIEAGEQLVMSDLTAIKSSPNEDQFWYEELSWNHDDNNPVLAYTKTWRYDEDDVSYSHVYTIKADGSSDMLISENKDQPIWAIDSDKLSFLDLSYFDVSDGTSKQINVGGINNEISGGSFSPNGGDYILFEIGDENRKAGLAKTDGASNHGVQYGTSVDVYEPRWSPKPL